MLGRILVGLILMGVGVGMIMYASQLVDVFNQNPEYANYIRIAGMIVIVISVLMMFGVLGLGSPDTLTLGSNTLQ